MLNVILFVIGIYLALVGAGVTVMFIASSNWYLNRCTKITKGIVDNMDFDDYE